MHKVICLLVCLKSSTFTDLGSCTESHKSILSGKASGHTVICPGLCLTLYWFAGARHLLRGGLVLDLFHFLLSLLTYSLNVHSNIFLDRNLYWLERNIVFWALRSPWAATAYLLMCFAKRSFPRDDAFFPTKRFSRHFFGAWTIGDPLKNYSKGW